MIDFAPQTEFNLFMKRDSTTELCFPLVHKCRLHLIEFPPFLYSVSTDFIAVSAKSWRCVVAALYQILLLGKCEIIYPFGAADVRLTARSLAECMWAAFQFCLFNPKVNVQKASLCKIKEYNLPLPEDLCTSIFVFEFSFAAHVQGAYTFLEAAFSTLAKTTTTWELLAAVWAQVSYIESFFNGSNQLWEVCAKAEFLFEVPDWKRMELDSFILTNIKPCILRKILFFTMPFHEEELRRCCR